MPNTYEISDAHSRDYSAPYWSIYPNQPDTAGSLPWSPSPFDGGGCIPWKPAPTTASITLTEPRKIRLKLSEVERLREAARGDDALKAVLQKFAGHIEIEVDFA